MPSNLRARDRPLLWWQILGLLGAGGLSFLGSAYWSLSYESTSVGERGQDKKALNQRQVENGGPQDFLTEQLASSELTAITPEGTPPKHPEKPKTTAWNPFGPLDSGAPPSVTAPPLASTPSLLVAKPIGASPLALVAQPNKSPSTPAASSPLPFEVLGGISGAGISEGKPFAFLRMGNEVIVTRAGDIIDGYRIEAITKDRIELSSMTQSVRHVLRIRP